MPAVLDLTYVVYPEDYIGLLLAYITFVPFVLVAFTCAFIIGRREVETIYALSGQVFNSAVNLMLKYYIREPRPLGSAKRGYGMPSHHSQYMFFVAAYISGWLLDRVFEKTKENRCGGWWEAKFKHLVLTCIFYLLSTVVVYSRIHLGVHTTEQVLVGCIVGWIVGFLWHLAGKYFFRPLVFPYVAQTWVAQILYIKDSQYISNVLLFEFKNTSSMYPFFRQVQKTTIATPDKIFIQETVTTQVGGDVPALQNAITQQTIVNQRNVNTAKLSKKRRRGKKRKK